MTKVETLVVGAGISGLATAAALGEGADVVVLEADTQIGGYCKTVKKEGFTWDFSGHFFHFKHPEIEAWLRARMPGQEVATVNKRSFVSYGGKLIDFPFQKNIHQLAQGEFIDCLYDLYFARASKVSAPPPEENFKQMLYARFGQSIAQKFLIPYNEKLYATDLATLDQDAMGRFFPHADLTEIIRNMKEADNATYNATFTYPEGGAIEYVRALHSAVKPGAVHLSEPLTKLDLQTKVATTPHGQYQYHRLVSSAPFPRLLQLAQVPHQPSVFSWNQVLVFNLGFDSKGPRDVHWIYYPSRELAFYRVGFYDNIFPGPRMSLYVELGFPKDARPNVEEAKEAVLRGLRAEGVLTTQKLIAEHSVVMNPAYVHLTQSSLAAHRTLSAQLRQASVFSIGRYGGWTYCSIEDNILQARALVQEWTGKATALG